MAESQIMTALRVWAAVAWADGVLAEAEAEGLRRLLRAAELTPEERVDAARLLETREPLPESLASLTPDGKRGIYRAACRMAVVDHVLDDHERELLARLRGLLGVSDETARDIERTVPGMG
jgi:tellurite resistance protein